MTYDEFMVQMEIIADRPGLDITREDLKTLIATNKKLLEQREILFDYYSSIDDEETLPARMKAELDAIVEGSTSAN